jgi:hypothetical protein
VLKMKDETLPGHGYQQRNVRIQWSFRCAIAVCALVNCWICRFSMNPDGVSYLDMGDLYWKGNWHAAFNAYWSPLYGWLTGLMFALTKPSIRWEYPEVHLLNFAILIGTLLCFELFWRELLFSTDKSVLRGTSRPYAWAIGYLLFAFMHFVVCPLAEVSPDLLVAALVYLAASMMLRFAAGRMSVASTALLGVVLGTGYLAKAAMLPYGAVAMAVLLAVAWTRRTGKWLAAVALLSFLAVSIPFIAALSWNCHRLTFGDSGQMNVAWLVNGMRPLNPFYHHWQGGGTLLQQASHPTRKIHNSPDVYEFALPVAGTYPVWYDPSYWCAGIDARVHPVREIAALAKNMTKIGKYLYTTTGIITAVLLMMFLLGDRINESWRILIAFWPILLPGAVLFLMYAMVTWQERYTSGVTVVAWGALVASMTMSEEKWKTKVLWAASLMLGALVVCSVPVLLIRTYRDYGRYGSVSAEQVVVAERLRTDGIEPGDQVALIGDGTGAYWAHLEKVRVVAEIPHVLETGDQATAFWNLSPEEEQTVFDILKSTGAKAVIADTPPTELPPGWVMVSNSRFAVHFLR